MYKSRIKIADLLKSEDYDKIVNVKGWVRTRRGSKSVNFIALNDGSTIKNIQVVADVADFDEELLKQITTGACLSVEIGKEHRRRSKRRGTGYKNRSSRHMWRGFPDAEKGAKL